MTKPNVNETHGNSNGEICYTNSEYECETLWFVSQLDGGVKNTTVSWQLFKNTFGSHYAAFNIETYVINLFKGLTIDQLLGSPSENPFWGPCNS